LRIDGTRIEKLIRTTDNEWVGVKYEKAGYETAYSEWLPVPPPQLEVNVGLVQYAQPQVSMALGYEEGVVVEFDKYMQPATLTAANIRVTRNGAAAAGTIHLLNAEENPENTSEQFASKIRFVPATPFTVSDDVVLTVKSGVVSYAGVCMAVDFQQQVAIRQEMKTLSVPPSLNILLNAPNCSEQSDCRTTLF